MCLFVNICIMRPRGIPPSPTVPHPTNTQCDSGSMRVPLILRFLMRPRGLYPLHPQCKSRDATHIATHFCPACCSHLFARCMDQHLHTGLAHLHWATYTHSHLFRSINDEDLFIMENHGCTIHLSTSSMLAAWVLKRG